MSLNNLNPSTRKKGLIKARQIRKNRAEIKKNLKQGNIDLKTVFSDQKIFSQVYGMRIVDLISSLPGIGRVKAENIMSEKLDISLVKKTGGLGKRQKERFFSHFRIG